MKEEKLKVLHLYSDWRWTGPAEPVLQVCRNLQTMGHRVLLAYRGPLVRGKTLEDKVREMEINGTTRFHLDRYIGLLNTCKDLVNLPIFLRRERFDILHMHLSHDHIFGALCAKMLGKHRPLLVRTLHKRDVLKPSFGNHFQLRYLTDGYLMFTESFRREYLNRFQLDPNCTTIQPMTIDLKRFRPDQPYQDMRAEFGIPPEAPIIGIVGRFQKYRRMDTFLNAAKRLLQKRPETRFLVIGRSSQIRETVVKPLKQLGISNRVILAGYRDKDYVDTLACLDIFTLLMPGSDGTARAVREALAMGKPCVVSDYYMLPEIVSHEKTGLVVPDDPEMLAQAWLRLIQDPEARNRMGHAARKHALERFSIEAVGPALEDFYRRLLEIKKK